jgi:3-carboxy-cis,cis-muconate cycloisomerase
VAESGEGALAGALAAALEPTLGRGAAHDAAADAVQQARETGRPLADVLAGRPEIDLAALATTPDVGEAAAQVDAVLADHARLTEGTP